MSPTHSQNPDKHGKMVILVAPSGGGKSTFLRKIVEERDDLNTTITYTTRPMRTGEKERFPYHFVDDEKFLRLRDEGFFVEWAQVHGKYYGSAGHQIDDIWAAGRHVIMDVDVQGATTFKEKYPGALTIFIMPPSIEELRRRVTSREGKPPKDLELRMKNAEIEMARVEEFDVQVVNDEFEGSYARFKKIVEDYLNER